MEPSNKRTPKSIKSPTERNASKNIKDKIGASRSAYIKDTVAPDLPNAFKDPSKEQEELKRKGSKHLKDGMDVTVAFPLATFISDVRTDITMQVRRYFLGTIVFFVIFGILLAGEVVNITMKRLDTNKISSQSIKLEEEKKAIEKQIHDKNVLSFESMLTKDIEKDKLTTVALRYYYYTITVNGAFVKTNQISISGPSVRIEVREKYTKNALDVLPKSILKLGSKFSSDKIDNQFKISSTEVEPKISKTANEDGYTYTVSFDKLNKGNIVTLLFDSQFAKKLALPENKVEIIYNK